MAFVAIASQTLSSPAATITFSSIPTTQNGFNLRDLMLVINGGTSAGLSYPYIQFNGSVTTIYGSVTMRGNGSTTSANNAGSFDKLWGDPNFSTISSTFNYAAIVNIMDYAQTDRNKTALFRSGTPDLYVTSTIGTWRSTSAITSMLVGLDGASWATGTTFRLYGFAA